MGGVFRAQVKIQTYLDLVDAAAIFRLKRRGQSSYNDVEWKNGKEFSADDVAHGNNYWDILAAVDGEVKDGFKWKFDMESPCDLMTRSCYSF